MTLEEIFYASQSLAAVAVIASILYLAQQVRQAERVQRGIMQQGRADRISIASLMMAEPALARIYQRAQSGDPQLTREEFTQWMFMCRSMFISAEDSFLQHRAGLFSSEAFNSYVAAVHRYMALPGMRAAWKISATQFGRDFRDFVDATVRDLPASRGIDAFTEWQNLVRAESGAAPTQA